VGIESTGSDQFADVSSADGKHDGIARHATA
jgi:hypothetical protein